MVAATGLLSIVGTLLAYGGYTFINRLGKNVTSTLNKTQDNTLNFGEFINLLDNITLPKNISQSSENTENVIKKVQNKNETIELNVFNQTRLLQNVSNIELNDVGSILPLGRELHDTNELIASDSNEDSDPNQNPTASYPHAPDMDFSEQELNNIEYDGQLNPKLILTTNNNEEKIKISEKEKLILKKLFDFEPFPSNKLQNRKNIDKLPQNPHYGKNHLETIGTKLKNPFLLSHDENEDHFQNDLLDLNESDIQSYKEKVNFSNENEDTFKEDLLDLNEIDIQLHKEKVYHSHENDTFQDDLLDLNESDIQLHKEKVYPPHENEDTFKEDLLDLNESDIQLHKEKVYHSHENDTFQNDLLDLNESDIQSHKEKVYPSHENDTFQNDLLDLNESDIQLHKEKVYPSHENDTFQNDLLDLNESDIQSHKEKVYPSYENEDTFQDDLLNLNESGILSYDEKVNPKLSIKFNSNLESNVDKTNGETILNNETVSMVDDDDDDDDLEMDINTLESNHIDNVDYNKVQILEKEVSVIGDLIDSLVSVQESENIENEILFNEVEKSFIGNENSGTEDEAKALIMSYAEIAGVVVGAILIITFLIFLGVRQVLKYRRDDKVIRSYDENRVNQIVTRP